MRFGEMACFKFMVKNKLFDIVSYDIMTHYILSL
jgi:hypothetical protein